jgi:hypothetical protein
MTVLEVLNAYSGDSREHIDAMMAVAFDRKEDLDTRIAALETLVDFHKTVVDRYNDPNLRKGEVGHDSKSGKFFVQFKGKRVEGFDDHAEAVLHACTS